MADAEASRRNDDVHRANKSQSAALCDTALVGTVTLATTDGRGGMARWWRSSPEMGEPVAARR